MDHNQKLAIKHKFTFPDSRNRPVILSQQASLSRKSESILKFLDVLNEAKTLKFNLSAWADLAFSKLLAWSKSLQLSLRSHNPTEKERLKKDQGLV